MSGSGLGLCLGAGLSPQSPVTRADRRSGATLKKNFSRACGIVAAAYVSCENLGELNMKAKTRKRVEQPAPFTPGVTKGMVRQHAYEMFRDKLPGPSVELGRLGAGREGPSRRAGNRRGRRLNWAPDSWCVGAGKKPVRRLRPCRCTICQFTAQPGQCLGPLNPRHQAPWPVALLAAPRRNRDSASR